MLSAVLRLRGLSDALPDNKIVEEVHHGLHQDDQKAQLANRMIARHPLVAVPTPVLSTMGHPSRGPRDE